jgi:hypothetical protein
MSLYVLILAGSSRSSQPLINLPAHYPDSRPVTDGVWVISTDQTTKDISEKLFPRSLLEDDSTRAQMRNHVVFRIDSWWGWHDQQLWEWLTARMK